MFSHFSLTDPSDKQSITIEYNFIKMVKLSSTQKILDQTAHILAGEGVPPVLDTGSTL